MKSFTYITLLLLGIAVTTLLLPAEARAAGVVGTGSPASCDGNDFADALADGGLVTFNCGNSVHTIESNTYVIVEDTTILGGNRIILDGENLRQHFLVENDATLNLVDIILTNGESAQGGCISINTNGELNTQNVTFEGCHDVSASLGGGAVYNLGLFTATNTIFLANRAEEEGGAILNRGTFLATQVIFEANEAGDDSGAIENDGDGILEIHDSIFIGNSAAQHGGALGNTLSFPETDGSVIIRRTLFVDNTATDFGGAINNVSGDISIENSTFVRNTADQGGAIFGSGNTLTSIRFSTFDDNRADTGAGIYRPLTGVIELGYSIVTGGRNSSDTANSLECDGPSLTSLGFNIIEDGTCVSGSDTSDSLNTAPLLGALADNGGFSHTLLPAANSPALEIVPADECLPPLDQRLAQRIGVCDIGAAERGGLFESAYLPRIRR